MMKRFALAALSLFLITGCTDIMRVQTGYVADRDDCRTQSNGEVGNYSPVDNPSMSEKEKNTAMLNLFCECMKQKDWKVAGCPKPKEKEVAKPAAPAEQQAAPTIIVVQSPPAAQEEPEACPMPNAPPAVHKAYKKRHPKTVCPTSDPHMFDDTDTKTLNNILGNDK